jgi:hypothetical protein
LKILNLILIGAVLFFAFLVIGYYWRVPSDLKKVMRLLSDEWKLVSWNRQSMGWLGKFVVRGRRFDVSSHRGYVEIYEVADDGFRIQIHPPEDQRYKISPEQVYASLTKAVA